MGISLERSCNVPRVGDMASEQLAYVIPVPDLAYSLATTLWFCYEMTPVLIGSSDLRVTYYSMSRHLVITKTQ